MQNIQNYITAANIVAAVVLAAVYIRSRIPKETIAQQGQLIVALNGRIDAIGAENKELHRQHDENQKAIADLQGQIKVYKELPLQEIARSLKALEGLPSEFDRISKENRDSIIKSFQNVGEQHVDNQTVVHETKLKPAMA